MKLRSAGELDQVVLPPSEGIACRAEDDMVQQQFKAEADVNTIVRRFGITEPPPVALPPEAYGDFSSVVDFQSAMEQLRAGEERFMALPVRLREKFHHSPAELWAYLQTSDNVQEAVELGILAPSALPAGEPVVAAP